MTDFAIEIDAWTGTAVETLRYATRTLVTGPTETPANAIYLGRIMDAGMLSRSLLDGGGVIGQPSTGVGSIVLNNQDGALDKLVDYGFDGRRFVLRQVGDGQSPAQGVVIARGVLAGADNSDAFKSLRLRIRDQSAVLKVPLLTARYAGTTTSAGLGVEGDASMQGQIKPVVYGTCINVAPKLVNAFDLVYQLSVGALASVTVYDGAVPLTFAGDFASTSALLGWTQVPGQYATCFASGLFRLGGAPAFAVTADAVEGAAPSDRSAARVASRMLDRLGIAASDRGAASFDTVHAFNPAEVGIFVDAETTAQDLIGQVLASIGAALVPTAHGVFQAVGIGVPTGTPAIIYDLRSFSDDSLQLGAGTDTDGVPAWSVVLSYGRVWQTMSVGDLDRANVSEARKAILLTGSSKATAQDATVKTAHPLAAEIVLDTLLVNQADAQAEAARLLAIHKARRDRIVLTVPDGIGRRDLGSVAMLKIPRFGFDAGKLFRVVSRQDDFTKRQVQLGLWG